MEDNRDYLTLSAAARLAPGRPHASAVWRWCRVGILSKAGPRHFLRHIRAGRRVFTTEPWLHTFFDDVAKGPDTLRFYHVKGADVSGRAMIGGGVRPGFNGLELSYGVMTTVLTQLIG